MSKINIGDSKAYIREAEESVIRMLAKEGRKLIEKAWSTNETTPRSYNMHDSYAYMIFHKGVLKEIGYLKDGTQSKGTHEGWVKYNYPDATGRGYAAWVVANYQPPRDGFQLLIVSSVYYSSILEDGTQSPFGNKYKIISQITTDAEKFASKHKGIKFKLIDIY